MLDNIENYKSQGTIIRSKQQTILNEEKPSKFFFLQEKQKQNKKHIKLLLNEQGKLLKEQNEILQECQNYFQVLYKNQETCETTQNQLLENITNKISDNQNSLLSQKMHITEIKEAIFNIQNGKSPGIDGLPTEFYKEFYETIKYDLQTTYNKTLFEFQSTPISWN